MKRVMPGMLAVVITGLLIFLVPAFGADVGKIGIIDFQKILLESEAGKMVQSKIRDKGRAMESDLRKLGDEIDAMIKQMQRDSMVMSAERREQQQRELEIRRYDFQSTQRKYQAEFREMEAELVEKLKDEVFDIAESIGKQEGYMLILERGAAIYYPGTIDITDRVIQIYNEKSGDSVNS